MPTNKHMTIGVLASRAGCTVPTIRYYEGVGLLPRASRRMGGHRVYGNADLQRLTFIRRCRSFGFSIEQIREFAELYDSPERDCAAARDLAQGHLFEVHQKVKELQALERSLKGFVEECNSQCAGGPASDCVILENLTTPRLPSCCGAGTPVQNQSRPGDDDRG